MRLKSLLAATALATCLLAPPAAIAASEEFCREYAASAEREVHAAHERPECREGAHGPRWTHEYRVHFDWCRRVHREQAEEEREARAHHLRRCGMWH